MDDLKLSHNDFIKYCADRRLFIQKITKDYVYLDDNPSLLSATISDKPYKIDLNWSIEWGGVQHSLFQSIAEDKKIMSIKTVRQYLNLGLRESKDIIDMNWENWRRIVALKEQLEGKL